MNEIKEISDLSGRENLRYKKTGLRDNDIYFVIHSMELFKEFLQIPCNHQQKPKVLGLGFGPGTLLKYLIERFNFDFVGIDISLQACRGMQKSFPQHTFIVNDVCRTELRDEEIDAVISTQVMEHVDEEDFIGEISRVLRKGGLKYPDTILLKYWLGKSDRIINLHVFLN